MLFLSWLYICFIYMFFLLFVCLLVIIVLALCNKIQMFIRKMSKLIVMISNNNDLFLFIRRLSHSQDHCSVKITKVQKRKKKTVESPLLYLMFKISILIWHKFFVSFWQYITISDVFFTEEAAGAGRHDGSVIIFTEADPEDQQIQPPAAGHAGFIQIIQTKRKDWRSLFWVCCVWPSCLCVWSEEQWEGEGAGWDPGCCRPGSLSDASWQWFAHHGRHPGLWCKISKCITHLWNTMLDVINIFYLALLSPAD